MIIIHYKIKTEVLLLHIIFETLNIIITNFLSRKHKIKLRK